jgi:hypothetical protein
MVSFARVFVCIFFLGLILFCYIQYKVDLTKLRLQIPLISKDVRIIQEENTRLRYIIEQFESPENLLDLAKKPQFSHLKQPTEDEIVVITSG